MSRKQASGLLRLLGRKAGDQNGNGLGIWREFVAYSQLTDFLILINSTLSQNSAGSLGGDAGGVSNDGTANVYNTTIVFNSADTEPNTLNAADGVYHTGAGTFNLRNTLLAGNYATNASTDADCKGALNPFGANLFRTGVLPPAPSTIFTVNGN